MKWVLNGFMLNPNRFLPVVIVEVKIKL